MKKKLAPSEFNIYKGTLKYLFYFNLTMAYYASREQVAINYHE